MNECASATTPCNLLADYSIFDQTLAKEMAIALTADDIVNSSDFCIGIPLVKEVEILSINDYLSSLSQKVGLYHLWVDSGENCPDHKLHKMICVYVGKGIVGTRIRSHIKEKWPESEMIYITFFECKNRIAKYLEQLFLDTYGFYLNEYENSGGDYLYGLWDDHRYDNGTETQRLGDILVTRL